MQPFEPSPYTPRPQYIAPQRQKTCVPAIIAAVLLFVYTAFSIGELLYWGDTTILRSVILLITYAAAGVLLLVLPARGKIKFIIPAAILLAALLINFITYLFNAGFDNVTGILLNYALPLIVVIMLLVHAIIAKLPTLIITLVITAVYFTGDLVTSVRFFTEVWNYSADFVISMLLSYLAFYILLASYVLIAIAISVTAKRKNSAITPAYPA